MSRKHKKESRRLRAVEKLESMLLEGAASGTPIEATPEFCWKKLREFARRHKIAPQ